MITQLTFLFSHMHHMLRHHFPKWRASFTFRVKKVP